MGWSFLKISHRTHACDPRGSSQPVPHFCCRQKTPPTQGFDQSPLLQADSEMFKGKKWKHVSLYPTMKEQQNLTIGNSYRIVIKIYRIDSPR